MKPIDLWEIVETVRNKGFDEWLLAELTQAFQDARKGKTKTFDENEFEVNWIYNLHILRKAILERVYKPGASLTFVIYEPMIREIFAAPFRDRIVHHFLYNMVAGWWDGQFIEDSYSCRVGKGTLYGAKRLQEKMRLVSDNFQKPAWVAKFDLRGYFMSLRRSDLYKLVRQGLDQQFAEVISTPEGREVYLVCKYLWKEVIFDNPVNRAIRRGPHHHWDDLPPEKSLFCQPPGQGIVIGNLTSQLMSNIKLNLLDRFVTETLGYQYYGRYVDDFYILVDDNQKGRLQRDIKKIEKYLKEELNLVLHPKKRYLQQIEKGVNFLGARVYPHCLYPSDRLQHNFFDAAHACAAGKCDIESIISYLGMMYHLDAHKFLAHVFEQVGWRYNR